MSTPRSIGSGALTVVGRAVARRCDCGRFAVTPHRIRIYAKEGRLQAKWAARLLPRADIKPAPPLCQHHLVSFLVAIFGREVRTVFWGDRLTRRRGNAPAMIKARRCEARKRNGAACGAPAKRGSKFCAVHENPKYFAFHPRNLGRQCKAMCVTTKERCKNHVVWPFGVCWQHCAYAARCPMGIAAMLTIRLRQRRDGAKRAGYHARQHAILTGQQSVAKGKLAARRARWLREERVERRQSTLYDDFREDRRPAPRLKSLYPV
jgi:hypothetical protein